MARSKYGMASSARPILTRHCARLFSRFGSFGLFSRPRWYAASAFVKSPRAYAARPFRSESSDVGSEDWFGSRAGASAGRTGAAGTLTGSLVASKGSVVVDALSCRTRAPRTRQSAAPARVSCAFLFASQAGALDAVLTLPSDGGSAATRSSPQRRHLGRPAFIVAPHARQTTGVATYLSSRQERMRTPAWPTPLS